MPELKPERQAIRDMVNKHPEFATKLMEHATAYSAKDEDKDMGMVCAAWEDRNILGCVQDKCEKCGLIVAVAPSSQEMIAKHKGPLHILCFPCLVKQIDGEPPPVLLAK